MIISNNSVKLEYKNLYNEANKSIHFPIFQRSYTWKKEQTEKLLEDILTLVYEEPEIRKTQQLYLLDFIWYEDDGIRMLADGQQRIVTFNILIICINEYITNNKLAIPQLKSFSFKYEDSDIQEKYNKFINGKRTTSPFGNVYKTMTKFILDYCIYFEDIVDVIKNNVYVYFKESQNMDDAFAVFTQINSGGKPLSKDDVMKTTIKQYSNKYGLPVDDFNFKDIKNLINSYYKLTEGSSGKTFGNLAIMSFMNKEIVKDYDSFKSFYNYMVAVKTINEHSIYHVISYIGKGQLINILYALSIQGIDITKKREYIEKVLLPLCLMSIIWKIKKTNPGGVAATLFTKVMDAIKGNKTVDEIRGVIIGFINENSDICKISFKDFSNGLDSGLERNTKKALLIMDVIRCNTSGYLNVPAIDLEHIYHQNPCDDWVLNGWTGNEDERMNIVDNIGNYMLLCESVNRKIQNKYITDKKVEYARIIPMDKMLQTSLNTIDFELFETNKEKYIYERQQKIAKHIQKEFFFGPMLIL